MHNVLFTSSSRHFPHNLCYNPSHGFCADPLDYAPPDHTRYHASGVTLNPLATYLRELRDIRSSGANVPETSFYGPLANLLNDIGRTLKPRVRCIINPKNQGAGIPDGGFFTADQLPRTGEPDLHAQLPARGVMEVKGTGNDAWQTARSTQVTRYLETYGQVLVTN